MSKGSKRGLPKFPKIVLVEGKWVDGVTTRARCGRASVS
jgi:hypothetical protein